MCIMHDFYESHLETPSPMSTHDYHVTILTKPAFILGTRFDDELLFAYIRNFDNAFRTDEFSSAYFSASDGESITWYDEKKSRRCFRPCQEKTQISHTHEFVFYEFVFYQCLLHNKHISLHTTFPNHGFKDSCFCLRLASMHRQKSLLQPRSSHNILHVLSRSSPVL